jgi:hypothetical protein
VPRQQLAHLRQRPLGKKAPILCIDYHPATVTDHAQGIQLNVSPRFGDGGLQWVTVQPGET